MGKITRALLSVTDKTGLVEFAQALEGFGVEILSTGGTAAKLKEHGVTVIDVSDHTGFPEIMDGRVKTLHPHIHGGLLSVRDNPEHQSAMAEHNITPIDLVVVNLYAFESTISSNAPFEQCIENIDIGGPSMIRSAAKNFRDVTVVVDVVDYSHVLDDMTEHKGKTSLALRQSLSAKAFARTASYDTVISQWFAKENGETHPPCISSTGTLKQTLRYGENPDQTAALYQDPVISAGIPSATQIQGKELSYNNIHDADAALHMVSEFKEPCAVIVKHANPCGIACGATLLEAYHKALACDPVSAFGGIIAFNRPLTKDIADAVTSMFVEVVIAPAADEDALTVFATKKNLRLLLVENFDSLNGIVKSSQQIKSVLGGFLMQSYQQHTITQHDLEIVTKRVPTPQEIDDLLFAYLVSKHVKSNAIVLVKDTATIGIGAGQMSRVDSVRIAGMKAHNGNGNDARPQGSVLASDAFFPFADGLLTAAQYGVKAVIQPGGSVRDQEVIDAANEHDIAMVLTGGKRCFKH